MKSDSFSTSRYIGNKSKQVDVIKQCILDYGIHEPHSVVDLFSGTGCVSNMFLNHFPSVQKILANDIEPYAYIYTKARLTCEDSRERVQKRIHKIASKVESLRDDSSGVYSPNTVTLKYTGDASRPSLFTRDHAMAIDGYSYILNNPRLSKIDAPVMAAVLDEVLRKNFGYGHFHNVIRQEEKRNLSWIQHQFMPSCVYPMGLGENVPKRKIMISVSAQDALQFMSRICRQSRQTPIDIVFIDPPYTQYNYGRMYHILNTIVLHDDPYTNGLHAVRKDYHRSPFSQKSHAFTSFQRLFFMCGQCTKYICMSYCTNGVVCLSDILFLLEQNGFGGTKVYTLSERSSMKKNTITEVLIISKSTQR